MSGGTLFLPYLLAVVRKRDSFVCKERLVMFIDRRPSADDTLSAYTSWPAALRRTFLLRLTRLVALGSRDYLDPDVIITSCAQSFLPDSLPLPSIQATVYASVG